MRLTKNELKIIVENFLLESNTDPRGFSKNLSGDKTEPLIDPDNPQEMKAALDAAEEENVKDLHIGQFGALRGDPGRRTISFGPSAESNPKPSVSDITTVPVGYPDDPTPRQAKYGQDYMRQYSGLGDEDNIYSVDDTKTQSFLFDDDDDTEENDFGSLGKTDPSFDYDDDYTPEAGITLSANRDDDFDLSISDIDRDFGTIEDDDSEEMPKKKSFISRLRDFFSE